MKTLAKLFLASALFLLHCSSIAEQAADGEKPKPEANSQPCFKLLKRDWPQVQSGNYPVCRDFVKNLNSFCDEPPPTCERKIHPKFKNLTLPKWVELDPKQYLKIIEQMLNYNYENTQVWNPIPHPTRENIIKGNAQLWHAWIDLDHDGKLEHVLRFDEGGCNPTSPRGKGFYGFNYRMAVVDHQISQVDNSFNYMQGTVRDVLLHNGRAYVFDYSASVDSFSLQEPFSARGGLEKGTTYVCVFKYLK